MKEKDKNFLVYSKRMGNDTTLYYEVVYDDIQNKTLSGKTMYKRKGEIDKQEFLEISSKHKDADYSNAKIINKKP